LIFSLSVMSFLLKLSLIFVPSSSTISAGEFGSELHSKSSLYNIGLKSLGITGTSLSSRQKK
jgi:hypothetical protein